MLILKILWYPGIGLVMSGVLDKYDLGRRYIYVKIARQAVSKRGGMVATLFLALP